MLGLATFLGFDVICGFAVAFAGKSFWVGFIKAMIFQAVMLTIGVLAERHDEKVKKEKVKADFEESIRLAREVGVDEDKIIHNKEEGDRYFME